MLNMIKSIYFMKNIFLLVGKKLLKLVAYNKELQNHLDIKLVCYKAASGKYFLGDKNVYGKEFNMSNNKLIYKGEYLKGKRNGKGKEYDKNGNLIFEGEYLNGKRNGEGKEIIDLDYKKYIFQGEYLNGKRWNGYGYFNGNEKKECEIKNGEGTVIEYHHYYNYCDDIILKCEYKNGEKKKGTEIYSLFTQHYEEFNMSNNKLIYKGEYLNGKRNGKGKEYDKDGNLIFEGEYLNGKRNGKGKEYNKYTGKLIFEGEYLNGEKYKPIKI